MKYFRCIVLVLFFCSGIVFSQERNIEHHILKGETIFSIAQKYGVSIGSISKLNPQAKKNLQLNQVLLIPNLDSKKAKDNGVNRDRVVQFNHEVLPKETLYGIAKQYKTTIELLYKANPKLATDGLKIGQKIIIPATGSPFEEITRLSQLNTVTVIDVISPLIHTVQPKESLYAIAKQYGIPFKELKAANPKLREKGLSIGEEIVIPRNDKLTGTSAVVETKEIQLDVPNKKINTSEKSYLQVVNKNIVTETTTQKEETEVVHIVLPKETKYGIARQYGITVASLEKQNPAIEKKVLIGSKLSIRVPNVSNDSMDNEKAIDTKNTEVDMHIANGNEAIIDQLIAVASENIGTKYRSGGTTNAGFDCSGLMYTTFGAFDIKLPRSSIEQAATGEKIEIENVQKGDLVFFKTRGRNHINHVGMVVEVVDDEVKFIHSSTHGGVMISSIKEPYYEKHFAQLNRIIK